MMIFFFLKLHFKSLVRYFKKRTAGKLITVILFIAVFAGVGYGIFQFFSKGFGYLGEYPYFRNALALYSFELFYLVLFFLVWLGAIISFLFALFKSKNMTLLMVSPRFKYFPVSVLAASLSSSLWIFLFVFLPALWATALLFHFSYLGFILVLFSSILLLLFAILAAFLSVLAASRLIVFLFRERGNFNFASLVLGIGVLGAFAAIANGFSHHDIVVILSTQNLSYIEAPLQPVIAMFKFFPSGLAAAVVGFVQSGNLVKASEYFLELFILCAVVAGGCWWLGKTFLPVWQQLSQGGGVQPDQMRKRKMQFSFLISHTGSLGPVIFKETILLFRNTRNSFWLMFLGLLWFSYTGFNYSFQQRLSEYSFTIPALPKITLALQLLILVYFLSSLVLRFAFPSFSAERNSAWIFASSPLSIRRLVWAKFFFFATTFAFFAALAEAANVFLLHLPAERAGIFLLISVSAAVFVTSLGIYYGARFPNFETADPESLSTSIPGLLFVFASILYGALASYFYYSYISGNSIILPFLFALVSCVFALSMASTAADSASKIDFVISRD